MTTLLDGLNPSQRRAVTHTDGPLLILAGVGTGKTTVITRRIAWLIAEKRARPAEILALTFTEKAAAEMEERVDVLVPYGYVEAHIGTFHSFCDRILRENAVLLGLSPDYRILTEPEQAIFFRDHLFDLPLERFRPLGNPMRNVRAILALFSRAKDEDVTPADYAAFVDRLAASPPEEETARKQHELFVAEQRELADTYAGYQRLMYEKAYLDFGDLIAMTLRLFREHPQVLEQYCKRYRHILVDEFQDTNHAQLQLLRLLASHRNLTVCGDDDQSIYAFRGAAISNILGFQETFPDAKLVVLDRNYRSPQPLLDAAYRLIQNNNPDRLEVRAGIAKRLDAGGRTGPAPHQHHFETLDDECDFVAQTIATRSKDEGRAVSDFAVLVRSNAQATPFLHALNLLQIPWRFSGSRGLYDQEDIKTAVAFLRVLADPRDNLSLHYVAGSPLYDVPAETLAVAAAFARRKNRSLLSVLRMLDDNPGALQLTSEDTRGVSTVVGDLGAMIPMSTKQRTGEVLFHYLSHQTDTIEHLSNSSDPRDAARLQNIARLFSIIDRFAQVARYDRVAWFVDYLDALIEAGDNPPVGDATWEEDAVHILTIHQAKGLEFPIVFLVGLIAGRFPSNRRSDPIPLPEDLVRTAISPDDAHQQEERRLFYVGMTRAKEELYLTGARDYGGKRPRKPSLFVSEALDLDASQFAPVPHSPLHSLRRRDTSVPAQGSTDNQRVLFDRGDATLRLSYRQVDDYRTCPLKYKYAHILHVPARPHHSMIYGSAIHNAIRIYNMNRLAGAETPLAVLHDVFRRQWMADGFLTRQHEELRLREGLDALEAFHSFEQADDAPPAHVERRFSVPIEGFRLIGVFDRIDRAGDTGTIIDYKTAAIETQQQAQKRTKESGQLAIYALAYTKLFGQPPSFLELRFLTPAVLVGRIPYSDALVDRAMTDLRETSRGIRSSSFPATPAYQACRYCAYASICPKRTID